MLADEELVERSGVYYINDFIVRQMKQEDQAEEAKRRKIEDAKKKKK